MIKSHVLRAADIRTKLLSLAAVVSQTKLPIAGRPLQVLLNGSELTIALRVLELYSYYGKRSRVSIWIAGNLEHWSYTLRLGTYRENGVHSDPKPLQSRR